MNSLAPHVYAVGEIQAFTLTEQQQDLLQYRNTNLRFSQLLKEGTTCHSTTYDKYGSGK